MAHQCATAQGWKNANSQCLERKLGSNFQIVPFFSTFLTEFDHDVDCDVLFFLQVLPAVELACLTSTFRATSWWLHAVQPACDTSCIIWTWCKAAGQMVQT